MAVNKGYLTILGIVSEEDQLKQNDTKMNLPQLAKKCRWREK